MSYKDEFIDPVTGKTRTSAERQAYRDARDRSRNHAKREAAAAAKAVEIERSPYEARISELKQQRKYASRGERAGIERRLAMLEPAQAKWEAEQKQAKAEADFDRSELAKLALESIERVQRSGAAIYPHATQEQLSRLIALGGVRHQFPDADSFGRAVFELISEVEGVEAKALRKAAGDARLAADLAAAEAAKADLAAAKAAARKAQIPDAK